MSVSVNFVKSFKWPCHEKRFWFVKAKTFIGFVLEHQTLYYARVSKKGVWSIEIK